MNKLLGYSLIGVGLPGFLFFLNYKGTSLPLKEFWFVLCIFILIAGGYFFAKYKLQNISNQRKDSNSVRLAEIERIKTIGDKVKVTLENAEVKSIIYQRETINEELPSHMEIIDTLYDSNLNYKTNKMHQTYIVLFRQYNGKMYKFVSPTTAQNTEAVKMYIDKQRGIDLYIDPKNPGNYYFDFPF